MLNKIRKWWGRALLWVFGDPWEEERKRVQQWTREYEEAESRVIRAYLDYMAAQENMRQAKISLLTDDRRGGY